MSMISCALRATLLLLWLMAAGGCTPTHGGGTSGTVTSKVGISRVFVRTIKMQDSRDDPATTSALVAAFNAAGFNAKELATRNGQPPDANPAVYVSGVSGGGKYCLEGLVRAVRPQQSPQEMLFEMRQDELEGMQKLTAQACAIKFVASVKSELEKRKI